MSSNEIAIKIDHISKEYRLGSIGGGTLRGDLQSWWAKIRGKEDPNVKLDNVGKAANGNTKFLALNDVSFEVKKGEALGIIGHNGAGKSTLLKLLSRVTAPTQGTISYNGRIASMLEVGTGFHPELTGRENVYMNGAILGMTKAEISKKFDEIVAFAEMEKFIDTPVKRYSSGMYVKLAFSVAAHLDSEIMIMDEVLAVGDMSFQKKCLDKMREAANKDGRTVLYVSHNMNTIRQLCDRCVVLDKGRVIFEGDVEKAINYYMNSTKSLAVVNDCSGEHKGYQTDKKIHIDTVSFLHKDFPIFKTGDTLQVRVNYTAMEQMQNLAMRFTVQFGDKSVVGLATSKPCIKAVEGNNEIDLTMDLSRLAPGKYIVKMTAYSVNEFGMNQMHDVVEDAFAFEIEQSMNDNNNMHWNHNWWGHMMFPELEVE